MSTGRLEAFSDGVLAIIITIMVLELGIPHEPSFEALLPLVPVFLSYALSFVFVGIYWNNHHHLFQAAEIVNGRVLWANLHLLFWLSLIPFVTAWAGETGFAAWPAAAYGAVMLMSAVAYTILVLVLTAVHERGSAVAAASGRDWKGRLSLLGYTLAIALSFVVTWLAWGLYVVVAIMWLAPDPRLEKTLAQAKKQAE
jgi:uncharacterized membrane protein